MNTNEENNCLVAENLPLDEETVEEYHFPVTIKQEDLKLETEQTYPNIC